MQIFPSQLYDAIVKYLGPHGPDGLLAFVIFIGALTATSFGIDPYLATTFGVVVFALYILRRWGAERHAERMAEVEISKTELELQKYRDSELFKIERAKIKHLGLAQSKKGDVT